MIDFMAQAQAANTAGDVQTEYNLLVSLVTSAPDRIDAWARLGSVLHNLKMKSAACAAFARVLEAQPDDVRALTNCGFELYLLGRHAEALPMLMKAVKLAPEVGLHHSNLAMVHAAMGHHNAAYRCIEKAYALDPENVIVQLGYSFAKFLNGEWAEGFRLYESRFPHKMPALLKLPYPRWDGERVERLFVLGEQGVGDTIMFSRFLPLAAERVSKVVCGVQPPLLKLMQSQYPKVEFIGLPCDFPPADAVVPMVSLMNSLNLTDDEITQSFSPWTIEHSGLVLPDTGRVKVGVCWAGSPEHDADNWRSMALAGMMPLAELPGVDLFSLMIGPRAQEIGQLGAHAMVRNLETWTRDMADTASQIAQLDLVLTVDTAIAHLAGTMGKETWLLLSRNGQDWRWGRSGDRTKWYGSMTIMRQLDNETWADMVRNRVKSKLEWKVQR